MTSNAKRCNISTCLDFTLDILNCNSRFRDSSASFFSNMTTLRLPAHIYTQTTPDAGTCLFTSEAIPPGVEIFRIDRPLVSVLDSPRLQDTCSECSLWLPENGHDRDSQSKRLKNCQACKITKYCCKVCLFLLHDILPKGASTTICSKQMSVSVSKKILLHLSCLIREVSQAMWTSGLCAVKNEQTC